MATLAVDDTKRFNAFQENMKWFSVHYEELRKGYANKFVAVDNQKVVDSDVDSYKLIDRLRMRHGDLRTFVIEPVTDGKVELIL